MYMIASGIDVTGQNGRRPGSEGFWKPPPMRLWWWTRVENRFGECPSREAVRLCREELLGEDIEKLVPHRARGTIQVIAETSLASREFGRWAAGLELYALHKDGHEFPVEISLSPLETEEGFWFPARSGISASANAWTDCP